MSNKTFNTLFIISGLFGFGFIVVIIWAIVKVIQWLTTQSL